MQLLLPLLLLPGVFGFAEDCGGPPQPSPEAVELFSKYYTPVKAVDYYNYTEAYPDEYPVLKCGGVWIVSIDGFPTAEIYSYSNALMCIDGRWHGAKNTFPFDKMPIGPNANNFKMTCVELLNHTIDELDREGFCPPTSIAFPDWNFQFELRLFKYSLLCPGEISVTSKTGTNNDFRGFSVRCENGAIVNERDVKLRLSGDEMLTCQRSEASTTATPASVKCPAPKSIGDSEFPKQMVKERDVLEGTVGEFMHCPGVYTGKMSADSKAFDFVYPLFKCEATGKWIDYRTKYEAPPFMGCGRLSPEADMSGCVVQDKQLSGALGNIVVYPEFENYCPPGKKMQFRGKQIQSISCKNEYGIEIITGDGTFYDPSEPVECV